MRNARLLIAAISLVACAKNEAAKTDTAAPAAAGAAPAPTVVTAADINGKTVNGQAMAEKSDSVLFKFTCTTPATGNVSRCVNLSAPKDTTDYTFTLSGADSVMWTSAAYTPPAPKSPKVIDHVVGRLSSGKWTGTTVSVLASKPDSVVARGRWEATNAP
jgi:hypothetical protein